VSVKRDFPSKTGLKASFKKVLRVSASVERNEKGKKMNSSEQFNFRVNLWYNHRPTSLSLLLADLKTH
jgi:hypothetical protein